MSEHRILCAHRASAKNEAAASVVGNGVRNTALIAESGNLRGRDRAVVTGRHAESRPDTLLLSIPLLCT